MSGIAEGGQEIENEVPHFHKAVGKAKGIVLGKAAVRMENKILINSAVSLSILLGLVYASSKFLGPGNPLAKYFPLVALATYGVVLCTSTLWHLRLFKTDFSCSISMMVGMAIGMIIGLLLGAIVGATNGMFVGSAAGMLVGMGVGAWAGYKSGKSIMALLEGLMSGLMAGTMGAMLSVMLIADNLIAFLYLLFASCTIILAGNAYLLYREGYHVPQDGEEPDFMSFFFACLVTLVALLALVTIGPKSAFVWPGV